MGLLLLAVIVLVAIVALVALGVLSVRRHQRMVAWDRELEQAFGGRGGHQTSLRRRL